MTAAVSWQGRLIDIKYSRRKTVALHVHNENVEIRAPKNTPITFIESFIAERSDWLNKAIIEQAQKVKDKIDYSLSQTIPFMGFNVSLLKERSAHSEWALTNDGLALRLKDTCDAEETLRLLTDFYQAQARFWLTKKTNTTAAEAGLVDKLSDIRFRKTKTKWGHCTAQGRIQYNWQIMMAPESVIDYLVSHEVSHLKYMDHSARFWTHVENLHPTYKEDRVWLRHNGHRLTLE